jgi:hypothetical protein
MGWGPSTDRAEEGAALVRELIEALTASGNYLTAANRIFGSEARPAQETLGEALEKSLAQFERASEAARRLRNLFLHKNATEDNGR